jgi:hypothetical protein
MLFHIFCDLFGNLRVNSKTVKERAYSSLVRPKQEYSNCVWDPHTKSQIHQLEIVQSRAEQLHELGTPAIDTTIPAQLLKCYKHSIDQL